MGVVLSCDFETRSVADLRKVGVYRYAQNPGTDIWCLAWAMGDAEPRLWAPGDPVPEEVAEHVRGGGRMRAWNAQFERVVWALILGPRYGFPTPKREQWHCTAADAAALALPRKLGDSARVLGVDQQKDDAGHRLMLQMARPRRVHDDGRIEWWDTPEKVSALREYCLQDVRAEVAVGRKLRPLSPYERRVYLLDQRINDRGLPLDRRLIEAARDMAEEGGRRSNLEMRALTGGEVSAVTNVGELTGWLQGRGLPVENIAKGTLRDLLTGELEDLDRAVTQLRVDAGRSSVAKLQSMLLAMDGDDRARGLLLYHGASTGRWSGMRIQPHNFPRGDVKGAERYIPWVLAGEYDLIDVEHPVLAVLSSLLRSMIRAPEGKRLLAADYSAIEARGLAWVAGQEDLVEAFAAGELIYEAMAAEIYRVPLEAVTEEQRAVGKAAILGAGYQMGPARYVDTVWDWTGIRISEEMGARVIDTYRDRNHRIRAFWAEVEGCAMRATLNPGSVEAAGRKGSVRFTSRGPFLWCVLPSGRLLAFAQPRVEPRKTPWGDVRDSLTYMTVDSTSRKWVRRQAYGGLLTENIVQAICRDLMADAMLRVEEGGYNVLLTVHDEVLAEAPVGHGSYDEFASILQTSPRWADGLPVKVGGWEGERYRK